MDMNIIERLFLEVPELTEEQGRAMNEHIASLVNSSALQRLIRVRQISAIMDTLSLLSERRFDEAFAEFKSLEAWNELQAEIQRAQETEKDAGASVAGSLAALRANMGIKY